MSRCCCGKMNLDDGIPLVHNGYQHEVLGEVLGAGRNFCGPKIKHDMRDLHEHIDELESQLAAAKKALEFYASDRRLYVARDTLSEIAELGEEPDDS